MDIELIEIIKEYNKSNTSMSYHDIANTFNLDVYHLLNILEIKEQVDDNIRFIINRGNFSICYAEITKDVWIKSVKDVTNDYEFIEYSDGHIVEDGIDKEFGRNLLRHEIIKHW